MPPQPQTPPTGPGPRRRRGTVRVSGRSMLPTLREGDVLVVRWGGRVRPGDLVVVRLPGDRPLSVKRATGRQDGGWWVERDNPREGVDSWSVGAVPEQDVAAVVRWRLWPRPGRLPAAPDTGTD